MSKHEKEEKIVQRLERENRELKNTVRSMQRKLKQLNKGYYKFLIEEQLTQEEAVVEAKKIAKKICYQCHVGEMVKVTVGNRYWRQCTECDNRTKSKTEEK